MGILSSRCLFKKQYDNIISLYMCVCVCGRGTRTYDVKIHIRYYARTDGRMVEEGCRMFWTNNGDFKTTG